MSKHVFKIFCSLKNKHLKKYLLFSFILPLSSFAQDTIIVNIAHGSKPKQQYRSEVKTIGGKKGGHVIIQIDSFAYGFYFTGKRIHIFSA